MSAFIVGGGSALLFGLGSYYFVKNTDQRKGAANRGIVSTDFSVDKLRTRRGSVGPNATPATADAPFAVKGSQSPRHAPSQSPPVSRRTSFLSSSPVADHGAVFASAIGDTTRSFSQEDELLARRLAERTDYTTPPDDHGSLFQSYINEKNNAGFTPAQENHAREAALAVDENVSPQSIPISKGLSDHGVVFSHIIHSPSKRFSDEDEELARKLAEHSFHLDKSDASNNRRSLSASGILSHIPSNRLDSAFSLSRDGERRAGSPNEMGILAANPASENPILGSTTIGQEGIVASLASNNSHLTLAEEQAQKQLHGGTNADFRRSWKFETLPTYTSEAKWSVGTQKPPKFTTRIP